MFFSLVVGRLDGQTEQIAVISEVGAVHFKLGVGIVTAYTGCLTDCQRDVVLCVDGDLILFLELLFKIVLGDVDRKILQNV